MIYARFWRLEQNQNIFASNAALSLSTYLKVHLAMRIPFVLIILLACLACRSQTDPAQQLETRAGEHVFHVKDTLPIKVDRDYLMGKFDPATHPDFTELDLEHASTQGMYLRKEAYQAFIKMYEAARKDGIRLVILSAARNFDRQKAIWEAKWIGQRKTTGVSDIQQEYPEPAERALKILEYSSMPGSSRHHWGTEIDLNNLESDYFTTGPGKPIYDWLSENAWQYGFCQPYSQIGPKRPTGYKEEFWHWTYMPLSIPLTRQAARELNDGLFTGFLGQESASMINIVEKFVLGVNPDCL